MLKDIFLQMRSLLRFIWANLIFSVILGPICALL